LLVGAIWAGDTAISFLVQHSRLRTRLTARLEAAFGRPVEVGSYAFSIWGGPVLEADSVRVGEDPRFGNEYFMRADSMSVRLRWLSLLRGHIEMGTLSLDHPSLNLVRGADGEWNVEEWLPRPAAGGSSNAPTNGPNPNAGSSPLRFRRIEISDGRIDFKRGYAKLAFAFVDVNGTVETESPGRWRIDLNATPWRAAVLTQQPGVIHVAGHIGGTSSRLRPAALQISWSDASISDFFRLLSGDDYGVRGSLAVSISAHTEPREPVNGWVLDGKAELSGLHRWDLAARPDNPSVNVVANQVLLDPGLSETRVVDAHIEGPHSSARATAALNWTGAPPKGKPAIPASDFVDVTSSRVDLGDLLDWVRAFHPGVADATSVHGMVDARAHFAGWPPNLMSGSVTGEGAELIAAGLRGPARIGPIDLSYNHGAISLRPAEISWGGSADRATASFRIETSPNQRLATFPAWHVVGSAADMRGIVAAAAAFGVDISRGWDLRGPIACDLRWQGALFPWDERPVGTISVGAADARSGGASLRAAFLNLPIEQIRARVELKPDERRISLTSASAFGTKWTGTFDRRVADAEWRFALSGDELSSTDLDRWLDPRWRESLLDRMLPFLGYPVTASPEDLVASGTLNLGEFALEPVAVYRLQGNLKINGRNIQLSDAQGQFYGGKISGLLRANLSATPNYQAEIVASGVDGAALAGATPKLKGLAAISAGGQISIDAKGSARADLIASLTCRGTARARGLELRGVSLEQAFDTPSRAAGGEQIPAASAAFTCSKSAIQFQRLSLALGDGRTVIGSGSVGFDRSLDLRLQAVPVGERRGAGPPIRVTGQLPSPRIVRLGASARGR
jgi:AsmA family